MSARLERDLLAAGQQVVRVPTKLMAQTRKSARSRGKSDPIDALAVARAVLRETDLPLATHDETSRELKLLTDRRDVLVAQRTSAINRLRWLVHELDPERAPAARSLDAAKHQQALRTWLDTQPGLVAELARAELTDIIRLTGEINTLAPVQNAGGCIPAPPGYFERVREICDRYDVLLVSDEVICAFGRIGSMFACEDLGYVPDMITCAKGLTSGYSPLGAMIASDRLFEPFNDGETMFAHGYTFGGHPVSAAVGLANLDIFEREGLSDHVKRNSPALRATLEKLYDLPIVGDIRGEGYFFGIELVKDQATKQTFTDDERARLLGQVSAALFEAGLYCRTDDRGDPVVQVAPPLISGQPEFDTIETILRSVLTDTGRKYLHL